MAIWVAGYFDSPYIAQFMECATGRIHYGLKIVLCFRHFIAYHYYHKARVLTTLKICKCWWSLTCRGVSNMLLVLSITFHCHYYIGGCMCLTGPFQLRWLKGYINSTCYYHHQIGSVNLTHCYHCYIFPWLYAWDGCYIIFCHLYIPGKPGCK